MTAVLYFAPLLGGYLFVSTWKLTKYRAAREDSQRLYFLAAFYGIFVAVCAALLSASLLAHFAPTVEEAGKAILTLAPLSVLVPDIKPSASNPVDLGHCALFVAMSLIWGSTLGFLLNGLTTLLQRAVLQVAGVDSLRNKPIARRLKDFSRRLDPYLRAVRERSDDIEHVLVRSVERTMPIQVTLSSRKVYVGDVVELTEPRDERKTLRLLPLLSGYRDAASFALVFTTRYTEIYEQVFASPIEGDAATGALEIEDFEIVVQLRDVQSVNLFDVDTYVRFGEQDEAVQRAHTEGEAPPVQR